MASDYQAKIRCQRLVQRNYRHVYREDSYRKKRIHISFEEACQPIKMPSIIWRCDTSFETFQLHDVSRIKMLANGSALKQNNYLISGLERCWSQSWLDNSDLSQSFNIATHTLFRWYLMSIIKICITTIFNTTFC